MDYENVTESGAAPAWAPEDEGEPTLAAGPTYDDNLRLDEFDPRQPHIIDLYKVTDVTACLLKEWWQRDVE